MRDHRALAGNVSFALADTLASADALSLAHLGRILAWSDDGDPVEPLPPAPIAVAGAGATGGEGGHEAGRPRADHQEVAVEEALVV